MQKVVIWGCGGIARFHMAAYRKLAYEGNAVCLAAACDMNPKAFESNIKINISTEQTQAETQKINYYTDIDEMLDAEKPDVVDICLPAFLHTDAIIGMLNKNYNVICEKPMALNYEDCKKILAAEEKSSAKLMIAHQLRFDPAYTYLKETIRSEKFGKPLSASFSRLSPPPTWGNGSWHLDKSKCGGVRIEMSVHDVDMANWLFGKPTGVSCYTGGHISGCDSMQALLYYPDNISVHIEGDWSFYKTFSFYYSYRVNFERATLEMDNRQGCILYTEDGSRKIEFPETDAMLEEIRYFIDAVRNDKKIETASPESVSETMKIEDLLFESAEHGGKLIANLD